MLIFSQVRGPHSTGVASVDRNKDNDTKIAKVVGRPDILVDYDKRYDKIVDYGKHFLLGHNRYATTGKINQKNAHPFNFEYIVGCHNGTIPEYALKDLKKEYTQYGTDSEAVLANLDEYPVQDVMRTMSGAWAFVWFDRRTLTLNFLRNRDRYLCYCYSENRNTLFFASEPGFLVAALDRNHVVHSTIYEVTEDMHTKWVVPDIFKPFDKARQTKIVSGELHYGNHFASESSDQVRWTNQGQTSTVRNSVVKIKDFESDRDLKSKNFDGQGYMKKNGNKNFYRGFRGEILTKYQFEEATKEGCCWCDSSAEWGQPVRFLSPTSHICLECTQDKEVRMVCGIKN